MHNMSTAWTRKCHQIIHRHAHTESDEMKFPGFDAIAMLLLIVGGLNAGLGAVANYDVIGTVFGDSMFSTGIYALVGISALYTIAHRMGWAPGSSDS